MLKRAFTTAIVGASLFAAPPLAAEAITADLDQIAKLLKAEGYQAKFEGEGESRVIKTGMAGYNFLILPFDCNEEGKECKSVQFYVAFAPENKPTLEEMNTYASENRFGRVYLDNDRDPVIEIDVDLEAGGMSPELFMDNLAYWEAIMIGFAEFSFSKDDK